MASWYGMVFLLALSKKIMATTPKKKAGPKDRDYVNKSQKHEVDYEPKRKTPAKTFGGKTSSKTK
jgi:hypothetical protein